MGDCGYLGWVIALTALLRRNPNLSADEFERHWRDVHGPLIRDSPSLARHILRYEQRVSLTIGEGGYDGVATLWFRSLQAFHDFVAEAAYREVLQPDEERFLDVEATRIAITDTGVTVIAADPGMLGA